MRTHVRTVRVHAYTRIFLYLVYLLFAYFTLLFTHAGFTVLSITQLLQACSRREFAHVETDRARLAPGVYLIFVTERARERETERQTESEREREREREGEGEREGGRGCVCEREVGCKGVLDSRKDALSFICTAFVHVN
jgi:hypothetical protein